MRVVGSLTTLPKRIKYLLPTLSSIFNQTKQLDCLYLNIPYKTLKGELYNIPNFLLSLEKEGKIVINRSKDYGAITKIIPTLQKEKDPYTLILTFDDDVQYGKDVVKTLVNGIKEHPNACVGMSGWITGSFPFQFELVKNETRKVDWLQGTHCAAYQCRFLNVDELLDYPHLKKHDDHVLSWNITKNGSEKYVIKGFDVYEREGVRHIDSISGSGGFGNEVYNFATKLQNEGIYKEPTKPYKSIGFFFVITLLMFIVVNWFLFNHKSIIIINVILIIITKILFELFIFNGRHITNLFFEK